MPDGDDDSGETGAVAPPPTPVQELLERRGYWRDTEWRRRRAATPDGPPLLEAWRDRGRRGWLALSVITTLVLGAVVVEGVLLGLDRPVLSATSLVGSSAPSRRANGSVVAPPTDTWTEQRIVPEASGIPLGASLPIGLGAIWLLGAWAVDREARRALVVSGTWRDRPSIAYQVVALFVVTPIIVGGVTQAAWGAVNLVIAFGRAGGAEAGWRASAWLATLIVAVLVLRGPTLAAIRSAAAAARGIGRDGQSASRLSSSRRDRIGAIDREVRGRAGIGHPPTFTADRSV